MAVLLNSGSDAVVGDTYTTDPRVGSQTGQMPDYVYWANAGKLVRPRLIPVLMQEPTGMQYMPAGADRIQFLKAMIESLPKSITGLDRGRQVNFVSTPVSQNGDQMEDPSQTLRNRTVPSIVWDELKGKPITNTIDDWISYLMMDSELQHPLVISQSAYQSAGAPAITPDFRAAVVMFYEPNEEMTGVNTAFLCANFMPKGFTDTLAMTVGEAAVGLEQTVEFTAYTMDNGTVIDYAETHLSSITKTGLQPRALTGFTTARSANVDDDVAAIGIASDASTVASTL